MNIRPIAFYLPQYHPIPENDEWWGKGFTEWRNVVQARPRFAGHYQPHLPADLGFYDLRVRATRIQQAELARSHGIYGFCYYHYWFNGRRLLEHPVEELLASGEPNFPFCLCWANENWTRRWDGKEREILMEQSYSEEDDLAHFDALRRYFNDKRYIRINGKPLLLVYRLSQLPDPAGTLRRWRTAAAASGLPGLYVCNVESLASEAGLGARHELDAAVEFAPDWSSLPGRYYQFRRRPPFFRSRPDKPFLSDYVYSYAAVAKQMLAKPTPPYLRYPCVTPMWDNSSRRATGAVILDGATPELYREWLATVVARFQPPSTEENFIFINAWNEWAEGCHLEPCHRWERAYLEATRQALQGDSGHFPA